MMSSVSLGRQHQVRHGRVRRLQEGAQAELGGRGMLDDLEE
jgi:hypothetical protein